MHVRNFITGVITGPLHTFLTKTQRLYGWGEKNCRVNAPAKDTRFERISVMATLGHDGYTV